jgi:photosystem II stability/assembly factor-like uncharacterized protein
VHSFVILPDANHTLLLATHYGIFRSTDHGATWQQTAGGSGQLMQGDMTAQLSYNLMDPQRLYAVTYSLKSVSTSLGFYTSGDGGKTWSLSNQDASITGGSSILFARAGNGNVHEVYIYLNKLGQLGLKVSMDDGQHFTQAGTTLPFGDILGLLALPGEAGHLLVYGDSGAAVTSDGGYHWTVLNGIQGSVYEMTTAGQGQPIYAEGDGGIYVSQDGGQSFTNVNTSSYVSLSPSPQTPTTLYGKTGTSIYRSSDGGKTWSALSAIKGTVQYVVADPTNVEQAYLALSYPVEVDQLQLSSQNWKSLTPAA